MDKNTIESSFIPLDRRAMPRDHDIVLGRFSLIVVAKAKVSIQANHLKDTHTLFQTLYWNYSRKLNTIKTDTLIALS